MLININSVSFEIDLLQFLTDGDMDGDGFYYAELNGKRGLIPGNYVISVPDYKTFANKYL